MTLFKHSFPAKIYNSEVVKILSLAAIIIVATFPQVDLAYSVGIDPPLAWAFNFLFEHGLKAGKDIVFPHGPLAFLMYPLQANIVLAVIVTSLLKLLLVVNVYKLISYSGEKKWLSINTKAWQ